MTTEPNDKVSAAIRRSKPAALPPMENPPYVADPERYDVIGYRHTGRSGLQLPEISLGLWHNFGDDTPFAAQRALVRRAFDLGVTQFDLANNYGPPFGSAEENFGRILAKDLRPYRHELVITTKAGWDMWSGPYGFLGSRKYVLASLDESLARLGLDHVDIFYSHRFDPDTPLEETMGALATAVQEGKARYVGISSYSAARTKEAIAILADLGLPLLIHQPNYSMLNRWIEDGLLDVLGEAGVGCIPFSPLAQGLLTDRYLAGVPAGSRATQGKSISEAMLSEETLGRIRALDGIARRRGQSLAQMAIRWVLRDPRVTSALIGASTVAQLEDSLKALDGPGFSDDELAEIDRYAVSSPGIDLWTESSRR
jgi:L-glyceraldehyde 3-phosphate reductase